MVLYHHPLETHYVVSNDKKIPHKTVLRERLVERFGGRVISGAEIGVWYGETSVWLLATLPGVLRKLYLVDPWHLNPDMEGYGKSGTDCADKEMLEGGLAFVQKNLEAFGDRAEILAMTSSEASGRIDDGSLDFVFIDGDHSRSGVLSDIQYWAPKLKRHGLLYFHDYGSDHFQEVKPAVDSWMSDSMPRVQLDGTLLEVQPHGEVAAEIGEGP